MPTVLRIASFVLKALAAVVALAVTLYLVVNVAGVLAAKRQRTALSDQITTRIAQQLPATRERAAAVVAGIHTSPTHAWVAQKCDFSTNDSGWIVQNYREVCTLESVHVWQVASEAEARSLLAGFGQLGTRPFTDGACHRFDLADVPGGRDAAFGSRLTVDYLAPTAEWSRWCAPTNKPYQERRSVVGEIPTLDDSQGWLVVVQSDELVDEAIGCVHWSIIFCDNPFGDELAWGTPPG